MKKYTITKNGIILNTKTGRILKQKLSNKGYLQVCLCCDGIKLYHNVHRLIAEKYIPNPLALPEVNHKDGNKLNNNDWNLEFCTHLFNMQHAYNTGLINNKGENNGLSKLTNKQVEDIRKKYIPWKYSTRKLAKEYNVSQNVIMKIVLNQTY